MPYLFKDQNLKNCNFVCGSTFWASTRRVRAPNGSTLSWSLLAEAPFLQPITHFPEVLFGKTVLRTVQQFHSFVVFRSFGWFWAISVSNWFLLHNGRFPVYLTYALTRCNRGLTFWICGSRKNDAGCLRKPHPRWSSRYILQGSCKNRLRQRILSRILQEQNYLAVTENSCKFLERILQGIVWST